MPEAGLKFFQENWDVLSNAPWVFAAVALIGGGVAYFVVRMRFQGKIDALESHLGFAQERAVTAETNARRLADDTSSSVSRVEDLERRVGAVEGQQREVLLFDLSQVRQSVEQANTHAEQLVAYTTATSAELGQPAVDKIINAASFRILTTSKNDEPSA